MLPVIFSFSFVEVRSYYLLWASALFIFVFWTRRRAENIWGMDYDAVTQVLVRVYCAGILGSYAASVVEKLPALAAGEISFAEAARGLSSWGGIAAGAITAFVSLRRRNINAEAFAESASLPAAAMMAIGRIGCLAEGCCAGCGRFYASAPWWSIHLLRDAPGFYRFPQQLLESAVSLAALSFMYAAERYRLAKGRKAPPAFFFPLYVLIYSVYRLVFDNFRETVPHTARFLWVLAVVFALLWIISSFARERSICGE